MRFPFVLWDMDDDPDGNVQHCARHNLTKEEIEEVLQEPEDTGFSRSSGRPIAFGETSTGRYIIVVYRMIDAETARPVTAYEVPRRNRP